MTNPLKISLKRNRSANTNSGKPKSKKQQTESSSTEASGSKPKLFSKIADAFTNYRSSREETSFFSNTQSKFNIGLGIIYNTCRNKMKRDSDEEMSSFVASVLDSSIDIDRDRNYEYKEYHKQRANRQSDMTGAYHHSLPRTNQKPITSILVKRNNTSPPSAQRFRRSPLDHFQSFVTPSNDDDDYHEEVMTPSTVESDECMSQYSDEHVRSESEDDSSSPILNYDSLASLSDQDLPFYATVCGTLGLPKPYLNTSLPFSPAQPAPLNIWDPEFWIDPKSLLTPPSISNYTYNSPPQYNSIKSILRRFDSKGYHI